MNRLSKKHFWDWFSRHQQEYLDIKNKSKKEATYWMNELNAHLRSYFKCLVYAIEWKLNQPARLIITVDGNPRHFKKAETLVAKAPKIPGWTFVALEDPRPIGFMLEPLMYQTGIDPRELQFSFEDHGVLHIYHPLCTAENAALIHELASSAVYNLLGERSYGNDITLIEVWNLSDADEIGLKALEELPEQVQQQCGSTMVIDDEGNLVCI
jgi:hypothetical protein